MSTTGNKTPKERKSSIGQLPKDHPIFKAGFIIGRSSLRIPEIDISKDKPEEDTNDK